MESLDEALGRVGTEKAKAEKENRIAMAKEDERAIYSQERINQEALEASAQTNFSLLNFFLTSHSLKHCKTLMDAIRETHKHDLVHIRRLTKELVFFRKICENHNIISLLDEGDKAFYEEYIAHNPDPVDMAQKSLEKVNELARARSKANKYGIVTGKKADNEFKKISNIKKV